MSIKPVSDLYLITYEDGTPYKTTRDAKEAADAIGAGFKVEEFVSLENHRAAMLQAEPVTTANKLGNSPVIPDCSAAILRRWLAFGCGMKNIGIQLPRNLLAETEVMLAATMQEVNRG